MKFGSKSVIALVALVGLSGAAFAQADTIKTRKETMKAMGASIGALVKMAKGEEPFDAAKAKAAVDTMSAKAKGFDALFPKGTETGGETEAAAAIWSDTAGFKAALAKFETTVGGVNVASLDGVKASVGAIGGTCKGCHDGFRVAKK